MAASSNLLSLPIEVLRSITFNLTPGDLVQFALVCKHTNALAEPLLWTGIELHAQGYHESEFELDAPPPFLLPSQRCNATPGRLLLGHGSEGVAVAFFELLQSCDEALLTKLASRVKHLCTIVNPMWENSGDNDDDDHDQQRRSLWQVLPYFTSLETLELHGQISSSASPDQFVADISASPIPNLRFAKLSGYIPRGVAAWILQSGPSLERLELGMLDRPISGEESFERPFRPLPEEDIKFGQRSSDENDEDDDVESDYGSLNGENVIPRPLSRFLSVDSVKDGEGGSDPNTTLTLSKLKHLYLYQPSKYEDPEGISYSWSTRADAASLADWRQILLACSETLEILVLEQRPGAEETEGEGWASNQFMRTRNEQNETGSSRLLVEMLKEVLLKDGAFPKLRQVYLYGIPVGTRTGGDPLENTPGGRLMHLLKARGVRCEARLGNWCTFAFDYGIADWSRWGPLTDQEKRFERGDGTEPEWDALLAVT